MEQTKFKFADGRTKLDKADYRPLALKIKKDLGKGKPWSAVAAQQYGIPWWDKQGKAVKNAADGVKYYVGAGGPNSLKIVPMADRLSANKKNIKTREKAVKQQTVGKDTFPTTGPQGYEQHHIKKLTQYSPFFENLSDKEATELAEFAAERGFDLGNKDINALLMEANKHTQYHNWERTEGFTSRGLKKMKGDHIPELAKATMDDRKYALVQFLQNEQPKLDTKLKNLTGQKVESKNIQDIGERFVKGTKGKERGLKIIKGLSGAPIGKYTLASLAALGPVGSAFGAVDTYQRTQKARETNNPLDKLQAALSGFSTTTGATGVGEVLSTPADAANLFLDAARFKRDGPILGSRSRFKNSK
jgi:hypothetical protein